MAIPKVIHYIWLSGKEKPKAIKRCIRTWEILKENGFEIREWTEDDFFLDEAPVFVQEALQSGKWAFAADYLRLKILYEQGGVYLDSDVMIKKDISELLDCGYFTFIEYHARGFEPFKRLINEKGEPMTDKHIPGFCLQSAFFGAEKGCRFLKDCMKWYENRHFIEGDKPAQDLIAPDIYALCARRYGFRYRDELQKLSSGIVIYPSCYCAGEISEIHKSNYAVHCCSGSWRDWRGAERFLYDCRLFFYQMLRYGR